MSVTLKLQHEEGLRLRQQSAHKDDLTKTVDWLFVKRPGSDGKIVEECQQDEDPRRTDSHGRKAKLGTYTVHITAGMNNLVIERKGKIAPYQFKNPAIRNQVRVRHEKLTESGRKTKDGKPIHEWRISGVPQYIPPNTFGGVFVGDGQRAILDECPT